MEAKKRNDNVKGLQPWYPSKRGNGGISYVKIPSCLVDAPPVDVELNQQN